MIIRKSLVNLFKLSDSVKYLDDAVYLSTSVDASSGWFLFETPALLTKISIFSTPFSLTAFKHREIDSEDATSRLKYIE